jgi:hypothetical protein
MTALAADKQLIVADEKWLEYPEPPLTIAADTLIYQGAVIAVNTSGYVVPGSASPALKVLGWSRGRIDNTDGAAGAIKVPYCRKPIRMVNSAGVDAITNADVGELCYLVDDQTVARTSGGGDRPVAGRVREVHATAGVLVEFDISDSGSLPVLGPVVIGHADLTDGDTSQAISLGQLEPGFYVLERYLTTAFSGGGNSALTVIVGTAASPTNTDSALASISIFTGATPTGTWVPCVSDSGMGFVVEAQGNLSATFTCVDGVLSGLDAGSISFRVKRVRL